MRYFLGEETLRKGLKNYLTAFSYSNAEQDDLWRHLTEAGRQDGKYIDIKMIMDSWTLQMGYPVVSITQDHINKNVRLHQQHFFLDPNVSIASENSEQGFSWHVPVSIVTAADRSYDKPKQVWLNKENSKGSRNIRYDICTPLGFQRFSNLPRQPQNSDRLDFSVR